MKPGRELDAIIAEKVMGFKVTPRGDTTTLHSPRITIRYLKTWFNDVETFNEDTLPSYSTSIEAAWAVVEKMKDKGWASVIVNGIAENHTIVQFYNALDKKFDAQGKDAAHTICLAALKSAGAE